MKRFWSKPCCCSSDSMFRVNNIPLEHKPSLAPQVFLAPSIFQSTLLSSPVQAQERTFPYHAEKLKKTHEYLCSHQQVSVLHVSILCIIFLPLYNHAVPCVGSSHKIPMAVMWQNIKGSRVTNTFERHCIKMFFTAHVLYICRSSVLGITMQTEVSAAMRASCTRSKGVSSCPFSSCLGML